MSYTELHFGKLIQIQTDFSPEEFAKAKYIELTGEEKLSYYDNFIEALRDESDDYYIMGDKIYYTENKKCDADDDIISFKENEKGEIEYTLKFYNGGTCRSELISNYIHNKNNS